MCIAAKSGLSGKESATILGSVKEIAEWDRCNAITALVRTKKVKSFLSGKEMEMILDGTKCARAGDRSTIG